MADVSIKILGVERLQAKLTKMASLPALKSTMGKAVGVVNGDAKNIVPVDSGNLRNSIHGSVEVGSPTEIVGKVATSTEYAPYVEFGTSKMGARPFLWPALNKNKKRINQLFAAAVISAAEKGKGK
jgi:HK97 gp10 family phage protein